MRKLIMFVPIWLLLLTAGCTQEKDEMQHGLDGILSEVQKHEKEITDYENQLDSLEKKEQTLFKKTTGLSIEDREALESGVSRLQASLEERSGIMGKEEEEIDAAEETAKQLTTLPPAGTDEGKKAVAKLKSALDTRYELHRTVAANYMELLEKQRKVYGLLVDENVKRAELDEAIGDVNDQQSKLADAVRLFNESTAEVNEALKETQQPGDE
ncbi:hypothetical protein NCCP2716_01600 [Sporosarcina sp. NCCP-2716]|uniref:YkyA family protein n=1 Tax=Sporosarcina sp. NCCP-2716 TaxID=2943679 RepID=UPI00203F0B84|nr:YkyA family protein [Sporosarcina sp. NCCP-2716]GKV67662.1 hypothetical protein NCCP2716_01600 [Sporosarcina sp. NCCP-2716]